MNRNEEGKKLYIGNLPYKVKDGAGIPKNITGDDLKYIFEAERINVLDAIVISDRETNQPKGFGFIRVADADFEKALSINGAEFEGRILKISEARERERPSR